MHSIVDSSVKSGCCILSIYNDGYSTLFKHERDDRAWRCAMQCMLLRGLSNASARGRCPARLIKCSCMLWTCVSCQNCHPDVQPLWSPLDMIFLHWRIHQYQYSSVISFGTHIFILHSIQIDNEYLSYWTLNIIEPQVIVLEYLRCLCVRSCRARMLWSQIEIT